MYVGVIAVQCHSSLVVVTSRNWRRRKFIGVHSGFKDMKNVLIFELGDGYIAVCFIIILHTIYVLCVFL